MLFKLFTFGQMKRPQLRAAEPLQRQSLVEPPLRAELFSAEQMAQHGKVLARSHELAAGAAPERLLARLAENEEILVEIAGLFKSAVVAKHRITPAAEWLLDNFYLIDEQIRTAKRHLPKGYSKELPRLAGGPSAHCPRVYDIALETVAHGDGRIDTEGLARFVAAYQTDTELTLGELWAIPIMLRLALIENLRRVGVRIATSWLEGNQANSWADQMIETAIKDPKSLIMVIADMARSNPPMSSAFVAELVRRLQGRGPALALPLTWIEQRLAETGLAITRQVQAENQQRAADQLSISNSIGSLRTLGVVDWRSFVENMSVVEEVLRSDPQGWYGQMDFATRDRYRHAVEAIARRGGWSEREVARRAVDLARAAAASDGGTADAKAGGDRAGHVGFHLIDEGLPELERQAAVRRSPAARLRQAAARHSLLFYLGPIAFITVALSFGLILAEARGAERFVWLHLVMVVLALLGASQLAVALVNWLATLWVLPHALPRMDFSAGIPPSSRTLVVVPTLLVSAAGVDALLEALEVRFLANQDSCLHFGLLTDFCDAPQESCPEDAAVLRSARIGIEALNRKYAAALGGNGRDRFYLFHRPRRWNAQERIWMGHERKRGKLADLNALLQGLKPRAPASAQGPDQSGFSLIVGDTTAIAGLRYVITLDTDTQLPRDAARQFVATMAHPLNRPCYDPLRRRVVRGYGIVQPRVAISLPGTKRSRYARLHGGEPGIDPYTRAVSDVYQDVFGEGSFIGKGIYQIDAFEQALAGRFPDNRILSHDLLEGCYARCGLLSDVHLYEDYPARYLADVSRRHRWIRGDWQLAAWLLRRVPGERSMTGGHPLSMLSQWKLFDNLRRSLVPAALCLLLLLGWALMAAPWLWTLAVIGIMLVPALGAAVVELFRRPKEVLLRQHLAAVAQGLTRRLGQWVFDLACLPYEACFSLDAIASTAWRMGVVHRRLLEWSPSAADGSGANGPGRGDLVASCRAMWIAPLIAAATGVLLGVTAPAALAVAAPILLLWLTSPLFAWWISRPLARRKVSLSGEQLRFLRVLARRTWAFFDELVTASDHWLPPDNFQEHRAAALAHRTSPTNMGLALLANLAAYDFGYVTAGRLIERSANALATMAELERHHGHFYNWYDTETLQPLPPRYVSTVDSGNLAGHLLTLRAGLLALIDAPIFSLRWFDGVGDSLDLVTQATAAAGASEQSMDGPLARFRADLEHQSQDRPGSVATLRAALESLAARAAQGLALAAAALLTRPKDLPASELDRWLRALVQQCCDARDDLALLTEGATPAAIPSLRALALQGSSAARARVVTIEALVQQCTDLADMDYGFLYDRPSHLLLIGYNVDERRADRGYYDLLASEARLCSFVAIAQGQLPQENWFALGRSLTRAGGEPVLLSWSGSMFEYLMPLLVMPAYEHTLLDQTCKAAVARQIEYGAQRGVPWGISESAYNMVDAQRNYQYRAFGVPGLGLMRGLADDLVVAPYASALALMVVPEAACLNLQRLAAGGALGSFGLFEAIDYTPARQQRGHAATVVRAFMAHHQGMSLLALEHLLLDRPMQRRFESERLFQAVMLLLQERIPRTTTLFPHIAQLSDLRSATIEGQGPIRVFDSPDTAVPQVQLLSNGRYHVMVSNAGGGYSRWTDLAVTRWREDGTCDNWGAFCYLRSLPGGEPWSVAHQPTGKRAQTYEAIFTEGRAEFRRRDVVSGGSDAQDGDYETHTEIVVSPEDDIELRRVRITNRSPGRRQIEITTYAEVVLAPPASDALHPAFSKLFVQTEILPDRRAILCTRRPRSPGEATPWMLHLMAVHEVAAGEFSYETDRLRFVGRNRSVAAPQALDQASALSGTDGSVLDPIAAIRCSFWLEADQSASIDIVYGIAGNRDTALSLIEKYQDRHLADRVFDLSWTHSQVVLRQINATEADAQLYGRLASAVIYANAGLRAEAAVLMRNRRGQSGLWGYAISGDLPIVLLQIADLANIDLARQLVQAHAYWSLKGLAVDLVIWNDDRGGYRQALQEQVMGLIASGMGASADDRPGGIFVRPAEQISGEDRDLFQSVARAIISDERGTLVEQLDHRRALAPRVPDFAATRSAPVEALAPPSPAPPQDLILGNGLGGFTRDGREYVITLAPGQTTPAPWVNVLANAHFGTVISESGSAYTWGENAHQFRLTPWHNDPVGDSSGEALYLRDEDSGEVWSPSPWPLRAAAFHRIRHGFGYSVFEHSFRGIRSELWVYVAVDAAVKFSVLKVRNESGRPRRLSATGYVEWVLGGLPANAAMHVSTEIDSRSGALTARSSFYGEFAERVAFFDVDAATRTVSADRAEFIGRNGSLRDPAALGRARLSGRLGAGLDPCGAIQVNFELADGQEGETIFRLGVGRDAEDAYALAQRFRGSLAARGALEAVWQHWNHTLGAVQVQTPDPAFDVLVNGWLVYQTLACRVWARTGYYQSGGAFGFRDQLQDLMALVHTRPELVRAHLLLSASRQFEEGDVQHWWHPPAGRGARSHCSDDYLWLPLAVSRYLVSSGDQSILDEELPFLEGRLVSPEDESYYDLPGRSNVTASLYEHCLRAIRRGLRFGVHGLPLIGSGDWNDGMNRVGIGGKGESVWLGFFLCEVLRQFAVHARARGDETFADDCVREEAGLRQNLEQHGWDGRWYRRAYFDDGTPLGSAENAECRIDSIAQSWAVLCCGEGTVGERARLAMDALDARLVRRSDGLVQLLDPPFDRSGLDPGYIRGYVPGVRENGGQYTHSAVWAAMAFAALGDGARAWELFRLINPVNHSLSSEAIEVYKAEPYVLAGDVYASPAHLGRGGWSWYTGSAGWMYRLAIESLLGLDRQGERLNLKPCLPLQWPFFAVQYRYRETVYHITVRMGRAVGEGGKSAIEVMVDDVPRPDQSIALVNDRREHRVEVAVPAAR